MSGGCDLVVPTPRHPREWRKDARMTQALERARGRETEPTQSKVLWRTVNAVGETGAKVVNINSRGLNTSRALETIEHFEPALQKGPEKKPSMRTQHQLNNFAGENNLADLLRQEARAEVSSQLQRWKPQENNTQEPPSSSQKKVQPRGAPNISQKYLQRERAQRASTVSSVSATGTSKEATKHKKEHRTRNNRTSRGGSSSSGTKPFQSSTALTTRTPWRPTSGT